MKARELDGRRLTSLPSIRSVGRPKKFESVEELEELIEKYFASCFVRATVENKRWVEGDEGIEEGRPGHFEYERVPATNAAGDPIYELIQQPSITGLAVALDTSRDVLLDYENKPENAEFSNTIKRAKNLVHAYAEQYLYEGKNQTSGIFNLKNNFGWVDRTETDLTSKGKEISPLAVAAKAADILKNDNDAPPVDVPPEAHDQQG